MTACNPAVSKVFFELLNMAVAAADGLSLGELTGSKPPPNSFQRYAHGGPNRLLRTSCGVKRYNVLVALHAVVASFSRPLLHSCFATAHCTVDLFAFPLQLQFEVLSLPFERSLDRCRKIQNQVKSVCDLQRLGGTAISAIGVCSTTIATDGLDRRVLLEPLSYIVRRSIREKIRHSMALQINENGAVSLPLAPSPVIDSKMTDGISVRFRSDALLDRADNGVITDLHSQAIQHAAAR